ncbi:hypothetical protein CSDK_1231 [Streptococcus dysgalactiae]
MAFKLSADKVSLKAWNLFIRGSYLSILVFRFPVYREESSVIIACFRPKLADEPQGKENFPE